MPWPIGSIFQETGFEKPKGWVYLDNRVAQNLSQINQFGHSMLLEFELLPSKVLECLVPQALGGFHTIA